MTPTAYAPTADVSARKGQRVVAVRSDLDACSIPCNLCSSTEVETIRTQDRHGAPLRSVICRRCGLVWTDPRPTPEQVRAFYEQEYRLDYKGSGQPKPKHTYRAGKVALGRVQQLAPVLQPGCRVLDAGAGGGEVVFMLRALGYDASGFEPNEGYARHAVETLGVPVIQGFYQTAAIPPESQDAVTMFHMMEHLEDPADMLRHARQWLRPGGLLVVEVPNVEAVCQQPHSQFHRGHLYHFGLATLQLLVRRAGYAVVRATTSPDGGNIQVIAQKSDGPRPVSGELPGNYERVAGIVRRHTAWRRAFSRHPYLRPLWKLAARLEERRAVRHQPSPREILEALVARERAAGR